MLAAQVPLTLHGVAMGLAGSEAVDDKRPANMARLMEAIGAESWSEHLAFVRAGGYEIGHLAAPPRTAANVDAAVKHIERAAKIVGATPRMENIATLIDPPGSTMNEAMWAKSIVEAADVPLLLDLHNLYANALNFGSTPDALLRAMPLHRVTSVHLSGGHWIDEPAMNGRVAGKRLLDDHIHDVPDDVFGLLETLAALVPQPLDVIIERDGEYPDFDVLLAQLDLARDALGRGRARRIDQSLKAAA
jgi:uncharacterized protein (UPF0276 family)